MNDILNDLNPQQREAVMHVNGPLLILAGAGSGKTRVLTYRIAQLIRENGIRPWEILAITFTNKAAQEMRERTGNLVGEAVNRMWVMTFHSMCARILRQEIEKLGYKSTFAIYDDGDKNRLIKKCLKSLNLDDKKYSPNGINVRISNAKNELLTPEDLEKYAQDPYQKNVVSIYKRYEQKLFENNALDFDDLLVLTVRLFQKMPLVLDKYREQFKYIMVDEYQDTNHVQYKLLSLLAGDKHNLCVVGDDDQSIYSFRGADVRNILEFENDFPETKIVRLEQNYRSTQKILTAANAVINENRTRHVKKLWTERVDGEDIVRIEADSEHDEAGAIIREIERLLETENRNYSDLAVFYRVNAQSRVLEEAMIRKGIPYRVIGGVRFYERAEVKDILAYLRVLINDTDSISFHRIINTPKRGIGTTSISHVESYADVMEISFFDALKVAKKIPNLGPKAQNEIAKFVGMIEGLQKTAQASDLAVTVKAVIEDSGYLKALKAEATIEAEGRIENIEEFFDVSAEFVQNYPDKVLTDFLEEISLVSDIDNYSADENAITMMTVHAAKGLEFPVVFMTGMEEGLFPHSRSVFDTKPGEDPMKKMEEERRLFYVAITRARDRLYLTSSNFRMMYGTQQYNMVSRFVRNIPLEIIEEKQLSVPGSAARQGYGGYGGGYIAASDAPREFGIDHGGSSTSYGGFGSYGNSSGTSGSSGASSGARAQGGYKVFPPRSNASDEEAGAESAYAQIENLAVGDQVEHSKYGQGKVISIKDMEITVKFGKEEKLLHLEYAKLKKV